MKKIKSNTTIFIFFLLFDIYFLTSSLLLAGNLDNPSAPQPTMKTLNDIYNRVSSGTATGTHELTPQSAPTSTMHTIQEIYDRLPGGSQSTANESDVPIGKIFIKRGNGVLTYSTGTYTAAQTNALPDTGQNTSYTTTYGEDNDYQPVNSQPSYTDNGNGTITDNRTGLMWVKDGNSAGCNNGGTLTWESALTFCENLSYASYTDWRLPNIRELESIVNVQNMNPAINTTYFPNTQGGYYWTSTTCVQNTPGAWGVFFNIGGMGN